ncbi:DUF4159 domain-containing protein [bacterium]|nr:DUF4159 domain-containing protein [bacterium]
MRTRIALFLILFVLFETSVLCQESVYSGLIIARVKYRGGGDWYNDPSAIPNLARFIREHTLTDIAEREARISLTDESLFSYPVLFLTGHGQWLLSDFEAERLRTYLLNGGFLYVDDDYGLDADFRKAMKKVFPERELNELPFSHGIYKIPFSFHNGLPKIHEHDDKPPRGFGLYDSRDRLVVFYTFETNISDGWADPQVHEDPTEKREAALRMGTNIILWALMH